MYKFYLPLREVKITISAYNFFPLIQSLCRHVMRKILDTTLKNLVYGYKSQSKSIFSYYLAQSAHCKHMLLKIN